MSKWDTIFKTGIHTSSTGITREWTRTDLDRLALNMSEDVPVVIHHPADQSQAAEFGKIANLSRVGDRLVAKYKDVPESLKIAVSEGLKLAKSVSIDPVKMKIRHLGLLGAGQPPAVEGLGSVNFSAVEDEKKQGDGLLTYTFNQTEKEETVDPKDKKIQELKNQVKALETGKETEQLKTDLEHVQGKIKTEKEAHDATKQEFAQFKDTQKEKALSDRIDALADSGRIKPAAKEKTLAFAKAMADDDATMEFSAPDGTKEKVSPRENYLRDLEAVDEDKDGLLNEFARGGGTGAQDDGSADLKDINSYA